ncbi:uncharacterized protein SPPG_05239 [Spizellomyces punctatus DAOM BR117]|uniref:Uncharacterized protein n=1 Tax=Spizellomyces punctatus (strain DAOM BR117) TaxID=645134 RepID=A0A0L0HFR1_SPIPD|nr:uncharacterized protein SPPG_05239 [Spizellomyces punctatus DAOM BR117]KNC99866.1 hypothetical protein SPPG_05239 [Spizellomyces punctatus DAOM BR117]|eukprot:XP_016607906.1 hypothetical protein SPPG_05239 [Spizellomyces punctatus DAOM BR117]
MASTKKLLVTDEGADSQQLHSPILHEPQTFYGQTKRDVSREVTEQTASGQMEHKASAAAAGSKKHSIAPESKGGYFGVIPGE